MSDYPAHPYLAPVHPGGLPGWNRCEDDRLSTLTEAIYCDRPEDDPIHDLVAAQGRADLFVAYATTLPLWPGLDYSFTAA